MYNWVDRERQQNRSGETAERNLPWMLPISAEDNSDGLALSNPSKIENEEKRETTRVVLAEDHPRVRAGIRALLEKYPDITVVGEADNGRQALSLVETLSPDVLVLDLEMPILNGVQVADELRAKEIQVHILVLSAYNDRQYVVSMLNRGVDGYLTKEEAPRILIKAIRGVARGEQGWVSKQATQGKN